jgi:hypothetical protein
MLLVISVWWDFETVKPVSSCFLYAVAMNCLFRENEVLAVVTHEPTLLVLNLQLWLVQMQWLAMRLFAKSGRLSRRRICMWVFICLCIFGVSWEVGLLVKAQVVISWWPVGPVICISGGDKNWLELTLVSILCGGINLGEKCNPVVGLITNSPWI